MTPCEISSWSFRYAATLVLHDAGRPLSVTEVADRLEAQGIAVAPRRGKTISDVLRTEQRKGRVVRVARGVYRTGRIPESTVRWFRGRVAESVAIARWFASNDAPFPTPVAPQCVATTRIERESGP